MLEGIVSPSFLHFSPDLEILDPIPGEGWTYSRYMYTVNASGSDGFCRSYLE